MAVNVSFAVVKDAGCLHVRGDGVDLASVDVEYCLAFSDGSLGSRVACWERQSAYLAKYSQRWRTVVVRM
jgi:hypothetical protein